MRQFQAQIPRRTDNDARSEVASIRQHIAARSARFANSMTLWVRGARLEIMLCRDGDQEELGWWPLAGQVRGQGALGTPDVIFQILFFLFHLTTDTRKMGAF